MSETRNVNLNRKGQNMPKPKRNSKLTHSPEYGAFVAKHMTKMQASTIVGGLSKPSKMPCLSWSTSAFKCKTGQKLAKIPGTVCSGCYAMKGNYTRYPSGEIARMRRYNLLLKAMKSASYREQFVSAFTVLLKGQSHFRWHDAGDLQGAKHLDIICEIARRNPSVSFWLPTREYTMVNTYLGSIPSNLVIRVSAHKVDHVPPTGFANTSTVHKSSAFNGLECRAYTQKGKCLDCRLCWTAKVANVSYPIH
jgi:hypothetical protein